MMNTNTKPHPKTELCDAELMRYSRQILLDGWDIESQLKIKQSSVSLIGMGGLGCMVAPILVRAGVGEVHLFDFDTIDDSNLQRQLLYTQADIGLPKAQIAKQALIEQNSWAAVHSHNIALNDDTIKENLISIKSDLWIDCSDNFDIRQTLNRHSIITSTALLSLSAIGETGQVALFEPKKTGCYACLFGTSMRAAQNCATSGVLASTVAVIGALGADIALHFLGKDQNTLKDTLMVWQGSRANFQKMKFTKNPSCPICQKSIVL